MARTLTLMAASGTGKAQMGLDTIPDEVKAEVENIYVMLLTNPKQRIRATFDTDAEMKLYWAQVQSYCTLREDVDPPEKAPAGWVSGELRARKSPARDIPELTMDFRVTNPLDQSDTEAINAAVEAVKVAAAVPASPAKATVPAKRSPRK